MNILNIGGGGFLGTNFSHFINNNGFGNVKNLDNGLLSTNKCEFIKFDVYKKTIDELCDHLYDKDVVINFAAITRVEESIIDPFRSFNVNTLIHQKVCESLRLLKNKNMKTPICILISTGGAIAGETKNSIDEFVLPRPISVYGASKLACESLSFSYSKSYNLDIRNLRLTNVYGPFSEKKESVIARFIKLINSKKIIEVRDNGLMKRDFIYSDDVSDAIYKMILNGKPSQTIQIGSGVSNSILDIIDVLKKLSPDFEYRNVSKLQGEVDMVKVNIHYAKKALNWEPKQTLESGIEKTWIYFKKQ